MDPRAKRCFEVSWEVCNKVGGIYTVVSSKALHMMENYGRENYFLVGPYFPAKAYGVFEETMPPNGLQEVFEKLKQEGIDCHFGKWLVKGEPNCILVDFTNYAKNKDAIKKELWDKFKIDSLGSQYFDFDEPAIWGFAVGRLVELVREKEAEPTICHVHEWLSGSALLYLKGHNVPVGTVFTTHATMLGRTMASAHIDLYNEIGKFDPEQKAKELGVLTKWQMEVQCANNAGAFTTVSEITAIEAKGLLGKEVDVILPNGLNMAKFPTFEEISIKHKLFKTKIKDFILYYFFPFYRFDLSNTLFFFIAGRHEFHDKGIDVFIDALGQLNDKLKAEKSERRVVAFFFVPGNIKGIKPDLLMSRTLFKDVHDSVEDHLEEIRHEIIHLLVEHEQITMDHIFDEDTQNEIKRKMMRFKKEGNPPLSTHDLHDGDDDVTQGFKNAGLDNSEDDAVKVVYYPIYLSGADGLLDTSYYESMIGCHLGVFPSTYEPWGYTPLEGGALGVPSVTTDLAGFGRYINKEVEGKKNPGIWVLDRMGKSQGDATKQLADAMYYYLNRPAQERVANKIAARHLAERADWKNFIKHYIEAHNKAMDKLG